MIVFGVWNKINWKIFFGACVIAAIVISSLLYGVLKLAAFNNPKIINTYFQENKETQENIENSSSPANTKGNTKLEKDNIESPQENKLVITEKDFGQYFSINKGQQVFLRLSNDFMWKEAAPKTTGEISLVEVKYDKDPGFREWRVSFTTPSTATIESNITTGTLGTDAEITKFFVTLKI